MNFKIVPPPPPVPPALTAGQIWKRTVGAYSGHHYLVVGRPNAGGGLFMTDLEAMNEYRLVGLFDGDGVGDGFEFVGTLEVSL